MRKTLTLLTLVSTLALTSCGGGGGGGGGGGDTPDRPTINGTMFGYDPIVNENGGICVSGQSNAYKKHKFDDDFDTRCVAAQGTVTNEPVVGAFEKDRCELTTGLILYCSKANGDCEDVADQDSCANANGFYEKRHNIQSTQKTCVGGVSFTAPTCANTGGAVVTSLYSVTSDFSNNLQTGSNFILVQDINTDVDLTNDQYYQNGIDYPISFSANLRIDTSWETTVETDTSSNFTSFEHNGDLQTGFSITLPFPVEITIDKVKLLYKSNN